MYPTLILAEAESLEGFGYNLKSVSFANSMASWVARLAGYPSEAKPQMPENPLSDSSAPNGESTFHTYGSETFPRAAQAGMMSSRCQ